MQDKARTQCDRISDQQRRAEMTVSDFEDSVQQLNRAARAPSTALIGIEPEAVSGDLAPGRGEGGTLTLEPSAID